ncbi:F-box only protein 6 isoform X2 [Magnolia sinica]|uniref:F-box only protein 6 isoform X2 n=1 Tax=Magnolia sinica TaxID=86752 RepID=UPI00265AF750|nr:F-box only protein 6 isoform X2 [Magnolia sinica]
MFGRWCFLDLDKDSVDDGCYNLILSRGKSGSLKMVEAIKSPPAKKSRRERNRERMLSATCSNMDERIWKEFPEDLFEAVVARLPVATVLRFRSVCRKWNSLLASHSFSQRCAEVPQAYPWFYTITHENVNSGAMYDPSSEKWHHPTIPSLSLAMKMIILPVASAGGLVCFLDIGHRNFYVCNPLTQSFRELPARSVRVWSRVAVGMTLNGNSTSGGYKILWLGCNGDHEVYDSLSNSWTRPGSMPSSIKLPLVLNFRSQAVSVDGKLYFMRANPDGVVSYDMSSGVWKQYAIPPPPHLTDHTLAESGGRIMLVGLLTKNAATCVCIWELQKMTLLWKEVDRMPNIWCLEFYGKHVRMTCLGNKGLLMLSLRSRQMNRLVTYNVSSGDWQRVPGCMLPRGRKRQWIACGTAFHPSLTALA